RFEPDSTATVVAGCGSADVRMPVGSNWLLYGDSVSAKVVRSGRSARMDDYRSAGSDIAAALPGTEFSSVGAPIVIGDRLWGVASAISATRAMTVPADIRQLPDDAEERIAKFADLI